MPDVQECEEPGVFTEITVHNFRLTRTGLVPIGEPTFDDWQALGSFLKWIEDAIQWLIGDWVAYGEGRFEERVHQAVDVTEWQDDTILQYARVARQVPIENRTTDLTFSHHREVADLQPSDQKAWLQKAIDGQDGQRWTVQRLRGELNAAHGKTTACWLLVRCVDAADRDHLSDQLKAAGRETKVP
jgi:hypothetical protein